MGRDLFTALESVTQSRRGFLTAAFGLAAGLLLPASIVEAARKAPPRNQGPTSRTRITAKARKHVNAPGVAGRSRGDLRQPGVAGRGSHHTKAQQHAGIRSAPTAKGGRRPRGMSRPAPAAKPGRPATAPRTVARSSSGTGRALEYQHGRPDTATDADVTSRVGGGTPRPSASLARPSGDDCRSLSLYCVNTGERTKVDYFVNGRYESGCLREISRLLRDARTGDVRAIDPRVLDVLYGIHGELDSNEALHIVCGYRSQATNIFKRLTRSGVAEHSYHVTGQAIDFFLPRRPLRDVHRAAVALRGGGVGYYPFSRFVHVDTGPVRYW